MSAAFTPGPWAYTKSVCGGDVCFDIHQVEIDGKWVLGSDVAYGQLFKTYASENGDIQDANAQLIAAAPELLKALQLAIRIFGDCTIDDRDYDESRPNEWEDDQSREAIQAARAAIAKATGVAA